MAVRRPGLTFKFSSLTGVLLILAVVAICAIFIINDRKDILKRTETESLSLARTVAAALANAVVLKEYAFIIDHCMLVVRTREDLRYIIVVKRDGESLIHLASGWRTERLTDPVSREMERIEAPAFRRHRGKVVDEEVLEAAVPISISKAKWGVIRLGFSVRPLEQRLEQMIRDALMVGLGCLLFGLVGVALLTRLVTSPIMQLTRAVRRIAAGELDQKVAVTSHDEIGELAESFNQMSQQLQQTLSAEKAKAEQLAQAFVQLDQAHKALKETQAQLVQSGRLASIGELAAGVAHEINNPLSAVLTYAIMVADRIAKLPKEQRTPLGDTPQQLDKIKIGAQRCKTIADNLLAFSRQTGVEAASLSLAEVVQRAFELLGVRLSKARVKVSTEIEDGLTVWGDANQLQQVVTNLAVNAAQAMEQMERRELTIRGSAEGKERAVLTIGDTGPGIPPGDQDRIFDPFFTTKPVGQGTGLGLSIVYGIIQGHQGEISVQSSEEEGTTFTILLPRNRSNSAG